MKKIFSIIFLLSICHIGFTQIPTNCIEIESILVDACGSPEGENEMVRFQIGPAPFVLASMTVDWPNNSWQGLCQNATTAGIVATWNSTITSCGLLIEPVGGVIPAGEHVIVVTSTNVIPGANSFAGLSDTIYVIFQCPGNTLGHFANYGVGLRTLIIYDGACTDTATYNRALLVDQLGIPGAADGGTVLFDWVGNPTYVNTGCNAPVVPLIVDAGIDQPGFCTGDTVDLNGYTQGSFTGYNWSGGTGSFINSTSDTNAFYIVGMGETNPINIFFTATNCNGSNIDTLNISLSSPTPVIITPAGPLSICNGDSITLTATGPGPFVWSTSETTSSIIVSSSGTYIVAQTTGCGTSMDTVVVAGSGGPPTAVITPLGSTALCAGANLTLQGSGGSNFLWNTTDITSSIIATVAGNYSLIVTNSCGSDTAYIILTSSPSPQANISPTSPISFCGGSVDVNVSGTGTFAWSTGGTGLTENFTTAGNYYVVATNVCGTDTAFFDIVGGNIIAGFTATPTSGASPLVVNFTYTGTPATNYIWTFGTGDSAFINNPSYTYNNPGSFVVTLIAWANDSACSDTATIVINVSPDLVIPQLITTNNDGKNDVWNIEGLEFYPEAGVSIYNRWGNLVYTSEPYQNNWAGECKEPSCVGTAGILPAGTYFYYVFLYGKNNTNTQGILSGYIELQP